MKRFFPIIKKKKNKRRLTALWLFLVGIELFCPALCGTPAFAAENPSTAIEISRTEQRNSPPCEMTSVSNCQNENQDGQKQVICNDECLCHAVAMHSQPFSVKKPANPRSEKIVFLFSNSVSTPLLSPYRPPKNS